MCIRDRSKIVSTTTKQRVESSSVTAAMLRQQFPSGSDTFPCDALECVATGKRFVLSEQATVRHVVITTIPSALCTEETTEFLQSLTEAVEHMGERPLIVVVGPGDHHDGSC